MIINIIILYLKWPFKIHHTHTDDFPLNGYLSSYTYKFFTHMVMLQMSVTQTCFLCVTCVDGRYTNLCSDVTQMMHVAHI